MKHTLKELDQFFDAARNETPIVDDKDFAALLDTADATADVATRVTTEVMSQSPTSQFGSWIRMAMNQHGGIMTGFGLTAVTGLLVTGIYLSSPDEPKQALNATQLGTPTATAEVAKRDAVKPVDTIDPQPESKSKDSSPKYSIVNEQIEPNFKDSFSEPSSEISKPIPFRDTSLWANVKIEGVKPLIVTPKEIEALGITEKPDGSVHLLHQPMSDALTFNTAFPLELGQKVVWTEHTKVEGTLAAVSPTMVTDAKGKKLAFYFVFDTSGNGFSVHGLSAMHRGGGGSNEYLHTPDMTIADVNGSAALAITVGDDEDDSDNEGHYSVTELIDEDRSEWANEGSAQRFWNNKESAGMRWLHDSLESQAHAMGFAFSLDSLRGLFDSLNLPNFNVDMFHDGEQNFDLKIDYDFDEDSLTENPHNPNGGSKELRKKSFMIQINTDSIREEVFENMKGLRQNMVKMRVNIDSVRRQAMQQSNEIRQQALKIRINGDSLRQHVLEQLKDLRLDTMQRQNVMHMMKVKKEIPLNGVSIPKGVKMEESPHRMFAADFRKQREMIDKLVPVQILAENDALTYNKKGLIFWYLPDEKFREVAPESLREIPELDKAKKDYLPTEKLSVVSRAGVIADPLVYPNPSYGRSTFKCTLEGPRTVSIALHDLLGKQVLRVMDAEVKSTGTFEKELDLSSLDAGVYLLVMVTDKGEQITERVVVER